MKNYDEQVERIIIKLEEARRIDKTFKVFGADSHKYILHKPISSIEISNFEKEYNINLPEGYKYFLSRIGNGGVSSGQSAAGPFYGLYPLGLNTDYPEQYLSMHVKIYPYMTDEYWNSLKEKIEADDTLTDTEYEDEMGKIYSGVLPIGSQGCHISHCLILNGEFRGRIVNIDPERRKPIWAFENDLLDWYERWLDEIISGELLEKSPSWFGYTKGGSVQSLLEDFDNSSNLQYKRDCLIGLLQKKKLDPQTLSKIEKINNDTEEETPYKIILIEILTKFEYDKAKPYLKKLIETDLLTFLKFIHVYAKTNVKDWLKELKSMNLQINDKETFNYYTYVIEDTKTDYANLLKPYIQHDNEKIRAQLFYSLGKLDNKIDYLDWFIIGLTDNSNTVVLYTLMALEGIDDKKLLNYYKEIAVKFENDDYITSNLGFRLRDLKLHKIEGNKQTDSEPKQYQPSKNWYEIWKK
jgi:SMI1 / KNR4 family (SUKH-1)